MVNRKLNSDMLFSTMVTGLSAGLNFLVQMAIVRWFGVDAFGRFSFWRNNVHLSAGLGIFGLQGLTLKTLSQLMEERSRSAIRSYYCFCIVVIGIFASLVIGGFLFSGAYSSSGDHIFLFIAASLGLALTLVGVAILRIIGSLRLSLVLDRLVIMSVFLGTIALAVVSGNTPEEVVFVAFTISVAVVFGFIFLAVFISDFRFVARLKKNAAVGSWKNWWRSGTSFFMLGIGNMLALRSTVLIGGLFLSATDLGRLAFMIMLAGLISLPLQALNQVAAPNIARHTARKEYAEIKPIVRKVKFYAVVLALSFAILLFFTSGFVETMVAKTGLVEPTVLAILLAAMIINSYYGPVGIALSMIGKEQTAAAILNVAVIFKIVALLIVVPRWSLLGIAVVEIIFTFAWNFTMEWRLKKQLSQWE